VTGAVEDVPDDEARAVLETMVLAPMRLARLALPAMRASGAGRIVNVSSIMGRTTTPLTGWYQASKHALEAVSDALRIEVAGDGIKVVLVEPGGFKTGIWEELESDIAKRADSRFLGAYGRSQQMMKLAEPMMGNPDQVAKVVGSVLSSRAPRARYLVGVDANLLALTDRFTPTMLKDRVTRLGLGI
jgi:NAD(P)-dependent dehydrogenase (short-subunit alcohol dehydrogenase family)